MEGSVHEACGMRVGLQVHALNQVCATHTWDDVSAEDIRAAIQCQSTDIVVRRVQRVPRRWHPTFGATWRRYAYLVPLNACGPPGSSARFDINVDEVNRSLKQLENKALSYNMLAYGPITTETDVCTLLHARAHLIERACGGERGSMMVVELVGNRFLRRMVRNLVASVVWHHQFESPSSPLFDGECLAAVP